MIDEVSLVWLTMSCVYVSVPTMKGISEARKKKIPIRFYIILVTTIITCLCFIKPWLNSFVLMFISIPGVFLVHNEAKWAKDDIARFFERKVFALWMLAMACWFSDRVFCGFWLRLGIPYFHAIFHLLSSIAAYFLYLLFVLLDIERRPNHGYEAKVKFFPSITIPLFSYIALTERKNRT